MLDNKEFTAIVLEKEGETIKSSIQTMPDDQLPEGDVTISVKYSTLNYKDGLILTGLGKLVRDYPHVPGIDCAGIVIESDNADYKVGDEVLLTGWRFGETHWGGLTTKTRVKGEWLVPLPKGMTLENAMAIGTAGFTAMLAVMALEEHGLAPSNSGEVLITGASGGVGSIATSLLSELGYRVTTSTGSQRASDYLRDLGANCVIDRSELAELPSGPLAPERWSGIIDNVGGEQLGNILASLAYWGSCASVGNTGGIKFTSTVIPFLLRGINLLGIDSNTCPKERRIRAWDRLVKQLPLDKLESMISRVGLADTIDLAGKILQGGIRGRTVVNVNE